MKNLYLWILLTVLSAQAYGQGLTIQENEIGFCSVDGIIDTDVPGYTGDGFANADIAAGTSCLWNIVVPEDETYHFYWRYANGGGSGDLVAEVWIDETPYLTDFNFPHTGSWTNWTNSDTLAINLTPGEHKIRLVSVSSSGLVNLDFLHVVEDGVEPAFCLPSYQLILSKNFNQGGAVSFEPVQPYYDAGTEISLTATPASGYFFQSWSGGETGTDQQHTFKIHRNTNVEALFYPDGTTAPADARGYVTVQDDEGTPFLITGGMFGDTVEAGTYGQLKNYLESSQPYIIKVSEHITSTGTINIKSDKTLLGVTDSAHLEGIRIKINGADNVIIRNMTFSKVIQFDEIEINNSHHIWIDHCEFFTDLDHGSEYYDGLLDIKNAAAFITVSHTEFHDHFKAVLISSGDDSFQDTSIRITFHNNYFHHLGSRTPLLRFGKAHIFNNYFRSCSSGINSRMGACIRVENNYFFQVNYALRTDMSAVVGYFEIVDNIFEQSIYVTDPLCSLEVPYAYEDILIAVEDVPMAVAGESPLHVHESRSDYDLRISPNPAEDRIQVMFDPVISGAGSINLYNGVGVRVRTCFSGAFSGGSNQFDFLVGDLPGGIYYLTIETEEGFDIGKISVH